MIFSEDELTQMAEAAKGALNEITEYAATMPELDCVHTLIAEVAIQGNDYQIHLTVTKDKREWIDPKGYKRNDGKKELPN